MKYTIIFSVLLFVCFKVPADNLIQDQFTLKGKIKGYGDGIIYISFSDPTKIIKDSIIVTNDKFQYQGTLNSPKMTFLKIMGNENLNKEYHRIDFFMENSKVTLKADLNDLKNYSIEGSKSNEDYQKLIRALNPVNQAYIKARKAYADQGKNSGSKSKFEMEVAKARDEYISFLINYEGFSASHAAAYILWLSSKHIPLDKIKEIVPRFAPVISNNVYLQYLVEKIEGEDSVKPGAMAANFSVWDIEGRHYSLDDYQGDYLLVAFSASWCVWCKKEYPYLKKAYSEYSDKGLNIITLNLDKERDKWEKDVLKEELPWPVLSDLKAFEGEITEAYSVRAIPRIFLINPAGEIVENRLRGEGILDKLEEVYSQ